MCRLPRAILALGFAFFAMPLFAQNADAQSEAEALPSITLPPEMDRVLREYEHAWSLGDAVALASLFTDDAFVLQNDAPPVRGRSAIQEIYQGQGGASLRLRALAYASGTTYGYIIGSYGFGSQSSDVGKFTLTLRRKPGERWMIFSDMDNSNAQRRNLAATPATTP